MFATHSESSGALGRAPKRQAGSRVGRRRPAPKRSPAYSSASFRNSSIDSLVLSSCGRRLSLGRVRWLRRMLAITSLTCPKAFCMFLISISRTELVRFRILMPTVSSFFRLATWSIAREPHFAGSVACLFTQCIDEQLLRWLGGRDVLEQRIPWFVPADHKLMGRGNRQSALGAPRRGDSSLADDSCPADGASLLAVATRSQAE